MIAHYRLQPGAPRHDALNAAAEPRKKMRLDKSGDDAQVGIDNVPIDQCRRAVNCGADLH